MKSITRTARSVRGVKSAYHPVALTSLLYLREALFREEYEKCSELIGIAREFGARESEIGYLLEDPRRVPG
ncbi:MAG: hypothetical protein KBD07_03455 [Candidatus Omnitrophica bacterium]|jgi:hypothetical protein|nr:hypothetical protein [Candidatus Omnitrophota bacterium]